MDRHLEEEEWEEEAVLQDKGLKTYTLYELQIKLLLNDAFIEGINSVQNISPKGHIRPEDYQILFEEWYENAIHLQSHNNE